MFRYYFLTCEANGRSLATTLIDINQAKRCNSQSMTIEATYPGDINNYQASVYFSSDLKTIYIKSKSSYDIAVLYGIV